MQILSNKIRFWGTVSFIASLFISKAYAISAIEERQLRALDHETRLEQRCDIEAMARIAKETRFKPDKVLAYAFGDTKCKKNHFQTDSAAFRAGGAWYRLSYDCLTKDDAMTILSFKYKIGKKVPRKDWDKHYLVP